MNLALFDFDGTITVGDTFSPFIRLAIRRSRMIAGYVLLSPLMLAYRLRLVTATSARRATVKFTFHGERAVAVRDLGLEYAKEVLPGMIRRRALERIRWHQHQGDDVVVVSASLDVYLEPWCRRLGVRAICTELEERNGLLTGKYCRGDCTGAEKVRRILESHALPRYSLIYAYGDTEEDREMLGLAQRKYYRWKEIRDWNEIETSGGPG